jgi:hypothetical protein
MRNSALIVLILTLSLHAAAASKPHVISFGKPMPVKLFLGPTEDRTAPLQVRSLFVDQKLKEFTTGEAHDVTDRLFVVRRAFRINNNLPTDEKKLPNWMWQLGGWLMVDRLTGRVAQINLPDFDPFYSSATWFRDYAAYCGIGDKDDRLYGVVVQLGRKKPVVRHELGSPSHDETPDADCSAPTWEKKPTRVTFLPKKAEKVSFEVFGHSADVAPGSEEE